MMLAVDTHVGLNHAPLRNLWRSATWLEQTIPSESNLVRVQFRKQPGGEGGEAIFTICEGAVIHCKKVSL